MKKLALISVFLFVTCFGAWGDSGTFDTPLSLQPDEATGFDYHWRIGENSDQVTGVHRWRASDGSIIFTRESRGGGWIDWTLRDHQYDTIPSVSNGDCTAPGVPNACCDGPFPDPDNACDVMAPALNSSCTNVGTPYPCCTANGQGVCQAWSQTFMYQCTTTSCDNKVIGEEMRNAIFNQWKKQYAPGKNITF